MPDSDSTFNLGSILLLLVLLALNGLAVAAEFAYVRVRRTSGTPRICSLIR